MTNLIKAWRVDFTRADPYPLVSAIAAAPFSDRAVFGQYRPLTRYEPSPGNVYGHTPYGSSPPGALWRDTNHSQAEILWLPMIMPTTQIVAGIPPAALIPRPQRTLDDGEIVQGLDLYGGRVVLELNFNNVHLPQRMQMALLLQWWDPEANAGRGANVNYLVRLKRSIDERMGYTPAHERGPDGQTRTVGWTTITIDLPKDDGATARDEAEDGLIPIDGRPDKVSANVYGRSISAREAYRRQLLNVMLVLHNGTVVPAIEPLARPGGGYGEIYVRRCEIHVDQDLNPNAVDCDATVPAWA